MNFFANKRGRIIVWTRKNVPDIVFNSFPSLLTDAKNVNDVYVCVCVYDRARINVHTTTTTNSERKYNRKTNGVLLRKTGYRYSAARDELSSGYVDYRPRRPSPVRFENPGAVV